MAGLNMRRGKTTTYGQKGGDGPNTGKRSMVYQATAPDGTVRKKRSFNVRPEDGPRMGFYERKGIWYHTGIFSETLVRKLNEQGWGQLTVPATLIT